MKKGYFATGIWEKKILKLAIFMLIQLNNLGASRQHKSQHITGKQ
jgi:hypothetical protein